MMPQRGATTGRASVGRFVAFTVGAGSLAGVGMLAFGPGTPAAHIPTVAALTVLLVASVLVPLRSQHEGGSTGFTLDEGVVIALLFSAPGRTLPVLVAGAVAFAHVTRRAEPLKLAYNFGNRALGTSLAVVVFHAIGPGDRVLASSSVVAAIGGVVAYNAANFLLNAGLRRRLTGASTGQTWRELRGLYAATSLANTAYGLVLAFIAVQDVLATLLAGSLMVGMYLGYRGYAAQLEARRRTERLHALTRTLIDVTSSDESMQVFLEDLRSVVGAEGAALLLLDSADEDRRVRDGTAIDDPTPCPYLEAAVQRGGPVLVARMSGDQARHRDAIAAPVHYEGRTVGAIAVYDRYGLEPWDDSDATLLGTIANEAAVALKNVELFATVERERALLAEESRKLSDIVNHASDGIVMIETDGRIGAWNDAMSAITGLTPDQTFGQPWFTVLRLRDRNGAELVPEGRNALAASLRGERSAEEIELQALRRDGQWRWLRCSVSPVERTGRSVVGAVLVARDVTREREVEELKGDFIATVSHELRTPLTPLRGFLETMLGKGERLDEAQTEEILQAMRGQVGRLERLVADLLFVADVERHELGLRVQPTDLVALLPEAVDRIVPPMTPGRVRVEAPDWLGAVADDVAVVRILTSLIDNAAKHTVATIVVRAYRDGDSAVVEVQDSGPGIAPWDQDHVFRRFGRLGNHLHRTQGPGLGLPIARALAQALGGDVTLDSDVGHGSTFRLTLPASAPRSVPDRSVRSDALVPVEAPGGPPARARPAR
ncbi:MAG TPA: ATP-binding protein [Nitriliruptorales bacterium]